MSTREETGKDDPIIEDRAQLISLFASGEKPRETVCVSGTRP